MKKILYMLFVIALITITSCAKYSEEQQLLQRALAVMETSPDRALVYLDSIRRPEEYLSKEKYMEFLVIKTQAKYKNYNDIKDDTAIFVAKCYYEKKANNPRMMTLANLYSGCVYEEKGVFENAMQAYNQAYKYAENTSDSLLMWRIPIYIGRLFQIHFNYELALDSYRLSAEKCGNKKERLVESYGAMGRAFMLLKENDSALFYYKKGVELSKQTSNLKIQSTLYQNISLLYREIKDFNNAEKYLKLSMQYNTDSNSLLRYHLNLAKLYIVSANIDSTRIYAKKLLNDIEIEAIEDLSLKASIYNFISEYFVAIKCYDSAQYYQKELISIISKIYDERLKQNVYEVQKKYDYDNLQRSYDKRLIESLRVITIMIFILLCISVAFIIVLLRLFRKRKEENTLRKQLLDIQLDNTRLAKMKEFNLLKITTLNEKISSLEKEKKEVLKGIDNQMLKNDADLKILRQELEQAKAQKEEINMSFENNLKQRIIAIKKICIFEQRNKNNKREVIAELKNIAYGSSYKTGMEAVIDLFKTTFNGLDLYIKKEYPDLSETEYKVCLLTFFPVTINDIADLLGQSTNTVAKARTGIRKKIGMSGFGGNISDFILKSYRDSQEK